MTQAKSRFKSIEEYAALDLSELPEGNYELVNGEIIELRTESDLNVEIAGFLFSVLLQFVPHYLLRRGTEIFVSSRAITSRNPDLLVLSEEGRAALQGAKRSAITREMPPPLLVVEVVSPGTTNRDRDYIDKRQEYAARSVPEYWLIDPIDSLVMVLSLENGDYFSREFRGNDSIASPTFPNLQLTAEQILTAGQ